MSRTFINWAGPYSATATYTQGDLATSGGAGFVSLSYPNLGNPLTDTAHWAPIGILSDATSWATLAHATLVTINGGSGGGAKAVPQITWPAPASISYGTPLSAAQLNATANALGTFTYSQASGAVLPAGPQSLSVTFTPLDTSVYTTATATVALTVAKAVPAITWPQPSPLFHATALSSAQLNATASCPGTFAYSPAAGTILPLGTATLTLVFTPTDTANYAPVTLTRSLTVTATAPTPALVSGQLASASTANHATPITLTLPAAPTPGNQIAVLLGYNPSSDYDYTPPDATWTVALGGRAGGSAGGANRLLIATKTVVPGDTASFTFYSTGGNGGGANGVILETSSTVSAAVAFGYSGQSNAQVSPALAPTAAGSLALALDFGAYTYPLPSGWNLLTAPFGIAEQTALSADSSTPISCTFGGYSAGNALTATLLFAPGTLCATPTASPAAGSTASATETVSLFCPTPGATIFYTLDGSLPTSASAVYSAPFTFDRTTQLNVLATAPGYYPSGIGLYTFVVAAGTILGIGLDGNLNGYVPFASDLLHADISASPVDAHSAAILANLRLSGYSHVSPDQGIGYNVVDSTPGHPWTTPLSPISDNISPPAQPYGGDYPTLAPMPANLYIEGNPPAGTHTGDNHGLVLDRGLAALFELDSACNFPPGGARPTQFSASQVSIFDLTLPDTIQRPYTYTSTSAGGNAVLPYMPRYDEIMAAIADGSMCLKHATRMTAANGFLHGLALGSDVYAYLQAPAMHGAGIHALALCFLE